MLHRFPTTPSVSGDAGLRNRFDIFPFGHGEWCCRRADGLVCGFFVDQECAVRFARRECAGAADIVFTSGQALSLSRAA